MYDNLRQHYKSLSSVFSLFDRSGYSSIICSAPTEEMMQCLMGHPNQFLIDKFIGKYLLMRSKHMLGSGGCLDGTKSPRPGVRVC